MKVYRQRNPKKLFETLSNEKRDSNTEAYVSARPTIEILNKIVDVHPHLKRLYCPPSLYLQVGKHTFTRARDAGIEILGGPFPAGRPNKYNEKDVNRILSRWKAGMPAKRISKELGIPLRTVYFYINESKG